MLRILASFLLLWLYTVAASAREIRVEEAYQAILEEQMKDGNILSNSFVPEPKATCDIVCPANHFPFQKPNHEYTIDGCGSYNININFGAFGMQEFTECCNVHDVCYEICDGTQAGCDGTFQDCLMGQCDKWAAESNWSSVRKLACQGTAKVMYLAVTNLGCKAYRESKIKACDCLDKETGDVTEASKF